MKYPGGHEVREHPRDEDQGRYGGLWIVPRAIRGFDVRARSSGGSNELLQFWATREEFEVGLGQHDIYIDLANAPCTPDGAIDFADRWGLLSKGPFEPWFGLNRFYDLVITMRGALDQGKAGGEAGAARMFAENLSVPLMGVRHPRSMRELAEQTYAGPILARFEWQGANKPRMYFAADSLWQFCLLEHLHALAGDVDLHVCDCGNYVRPPKRGGPPRRHCGDKCKMKAYRRRKAALRSRATS